MKKSTAILTAALFLALFSGKVAAQSQFSIGIKAAVNGSNYYKLTKSGVGFDAGVFMRFGNGFFFQPEVNYAFKSSSFRDALNEFSTNLKLKQHCISVPALLGYHFINNENFKFRLTLGPRFDFKVKDNLEGTEWRTNNLIWGGQIGLGIDVWRFTIDVNYCYAADNFHNTSNTTSQIHGTSIITTSLGFKFIK
ncbi:MAG: porin family protein [Bacteroidales bacterium]|nr:porin family protein [Bacteroidales bacterium]MDY6348140.1 porin family protein [Bacteroidales bacterium]